MTSLLYITSRVPAPNQRGDQLRAFHQLRILSKTVRITLVCLSDEKDNSAHIATLQGWGIDVHCIYFPTWKRLIALRRSIFTGIPFQVAYFFSHKIEKSLRAKFHDRWFDRVHAHLIRTALYAKSFKAENCSIDYMDAYGYGMDLRYHSSNGFLKRWIFKTERNGLRQFEATIFDEFDQHFAISKQDALRIDHPKNEQIRVSANGIDFDQFYPKNTSKKYDLVFMGNMDYPPNIAAATIIVNEVLPSIQKHIPSVKLLIAGRGATKLIQSYQSKSVDVIQHFDDISEAIASAKILLAPMMISIGLQNKLLQAMAMKVPCITSEAANNAIGAIPNEHILIANSAQEFIEQTLKLLTNESLQTELAESAYVFVHEHFTWNHCVRQLLSTTR